MTLLGCSVTLFSQELYVDVWMVCSYNTRAEAELWGSKLPLCCHVSSSSFSRNTLPRAQLDQDADVLTLVFLDCYVSTLSSSKTPKTRTIRYLVITRPRYYTNQLFISVIFCVEHDHWPVQIIIRLSYWLYACVWHVTAYDAALDRKPRFASLNIC